MNALDLAKVGKAFGFAVPPRVNVSIGGGKAVAGKSGRKRARDDDDEENEEEVDTPEAQEEEHAARNKERRIKGRKERRVAPGL